MSSAFITSNGSTDWSSSLRYVEHIFVGSLDPSTSIRVAIKDGSSGGNPYWSIAVVAGSSQQVSLPRPILVPSGVYVEIANAESGANVTGKGRVTIIGY